MTETPVNLFPQCAETFVVANTPKYLFRHLREIEEVHALANSLPAHQLAELCGQYASRTNPTFEDEFAFYVHLVALSLKPFSDVRRHLNTLRESPFKWSEHLACLLETSAKRSTVVSLEIPFTLEPHEQTIPQSGISYPTAIDVAGKAERKKDNDKHSPSGHS